MMRKSIFLCLLLAIGALRAEEEFHEELVMRPLPSKHVNAYFQFTTVWPYGSTRQLLDTRLTPRAIAEILLAYDVKELHISLTQGMWRYEEWGYPIVEAPPGAEVWAWFGGAKNLTQAEVDRQWTALMKLFAGVICATLDEIGPTNTIKPVYGFRPRFASAGNDAQHYVRYAALPRENVCTENLTPWKKLLPCASQQGFVSLLNSGHVHNAKYHSLALEFRTLCTHADVDDCALELRQTANLVFDRRTLAGSNGKEYSLRRLFGQGMHGHCVLARSSKVYVLLDGVATQFKLVPSPERTVTSMRGGYTQNYGLYDLQRTDLYTGLFNIAWQLQQSDSEQRYVPAPTPPPIYVHRYIMGNGQEQGRIMTELTNTHYQSLSVVVQELLPWYAPVYLHSLRLRSLTTGAQLTPRLLHYAPGEQRKRAYQLELGFKLPAKQTVQLTIDFDYVLLKYSEYPPDANHGHYLSAAVVSVPLPIGRNYTALPVDARLFADSFNATRPSYFQTLRTEPLLLSLPTPDFSMPYNVICLACTIVAIAFGPIHSFCTETMYITDEGMQRPSLMRRMYDKTVGLLLRSKRKRQATPETQLETESTAATDDESTAVTSVSESVPETAAASEAAL